MRGALRFPFFRTVLTGAATLAMSLSVLSGAALAQDSEASRLFNEGKDLFLKGDDAKALEKFEEVLRLKPDHATAYALREEAGYQFFIELLMQRDQGDVGSKLRAFARHMLAAAEKEFNPADVDQGEIDRLVGELEKSFTERWAAIEELSYKIGQQAAPALVKALGDDRNDDLRTGAVQACIHMGTQIVPALLEAIESDNDLLRQNCCAILGAIGDDRAKAELKRVADGPEEKPEVKAFAARALKRILGDAPQKSASEYYLQKAVLYYRDHPAIIRERDRRWIVWKWKGGELKMERVPRWLYHLRLSEEACYDAIEVDFTYKPIWPVMVLANASQFLEVRSHLARNADDDGLKELLAKNIGGQVLSYPAGQRVLFDALEITLAAEEPELAEAVIDGLALVCDGKDLVGDPSKVNGKSLISALNYHDRRSAKAVRYAAATALVTISDRNPALKAPGRKPAWAERVVEVLAEAVGESGTRTLLVVDAESQNRRAMAEELISLGYFVVEAGDVHNGLRRAKAFPSVDAIVLSAELAHAETFALTSPTGERHRETLVDALRDDYRTAEIPIIVAADAAGLERAKSLFAKDGKGFVTRSVPPNREELRAEVGRVMDDHPSEMKGAADRMSARASNTLAMIDPHHTVYPVAKAVPALVGVLEARPDEVRAPALLALARIGQATAVPAIAALYANTGDNSPAIRAAGARALGEVMLRSGAALPADAFDSLLKGLNDPAPEVQVATGEGLGKMNLTDEQRLQVYKTRRIHYRD
ncbi:MAG: HEAT repeat domain-containing protein [Planctomycetota bacterium]|jgi:HEAT repeat protein